MKLSVLLNNIEVLSPPPCDPEITFVTDDSRRAAPGCAFVCIRGNSFDGHTAAADAVAKGAAVVVALEKTGVEHEVLVPDTRAAYSLMCAAFFGNPAARLNIVGVTGTNGKTTTCFLLKSILESAGKTTGLIGTVKNMIADKEYPSSLTTPDPMELHSMFARMLEAGCTHCVMEVSSQALAQRRVEGIRFAAAIFTNLTRDHLDYHGSFENYRDAKRILFENTDLAIINLDDDAASAMTSGVSCPVVTFSVRTDASDYTAKNLNMRDSGCEYELVGKGVIGRVRFRVPGLFSVYNSMGAAVCAAELGLPFRDVLSSLAGTSGVPGRLENVPTGRDFSVIIDYAHTPDGLENVLSALNEIKAGRVITVFGCGGDRDRTKRPIMGRIAAALSDIVIVTSDNPRTEEPEGIIDDITEGIEKPKIPVFRECDRTAAIALALKKAKPGDIVLLAGKGHETYQILGTGKIHYDEREVVARLLE